MLETCRTVTSLTSPTLIACHGHKDSAKTRLNQYKNEWRKLKRLLSMNSDLDTIYVLFG